MNIAAHNKKLIRDAGNAAPLVKGDTSAYGTEVNNEQTLIHAVFDYSYPSDLQLNNTLRMGLHVRNFYNF